MRLRLKAALLSLIPLTLGLAAPAVAQPALDSFAILAGSTITNTGTSTIGGNVGLSPGSAVTGFGSATVTGTIFVADAVAIQAQIDLVNAYNSLLSRPTTFDLTGVDLGGQVLRPGVYSFNTSAQLTGTLTLDAQGNPNAMFIFKVGSTLTTASASSVVLINGAQGGNVFFVVGSSATLGSSTTFTGRILALTSISLITSATVNCGAVLARNGSVTLQSNVITTVCPLIATTVGDVVGPSATNAAVVAGAIDAFVAGGGVLPPGFADLLAFLTPAELAAALAELSGEAATGVAPSGMQAMDSFMSQIFNSAFDENLPDRPGTVTVKALGYGPEDEAQAKAGSAFASFDKSPGSAPWDVWASTYGGQYNVNGDSSQGTHDRFANAFGFAAGLGYRITPETKVGFAIGAGGTNYDLAGGMGSGESDTFHAALYGRRDFSAAYVTGVVAYGWNGISTDRTLTLAGPDRLTASFDAQNVAGRLEAGYRMGWFTPYAGIGMQAFYSPAYSETSSTGSPFALHYNSQTATDVRTELGLRVARNIALGDGAKLRLHSGVAWAHDTWSDLGLVAQFQALPGSTFAVQGAVPPSDLLLVSAGAEVGLANGFSIASLFDGEFADGTQKYEGRVKVRYAW